MKDELYTIPVNEAFDTDCECPICSMYDSLERDSIEYAMGPSYMDDTIRAETDKIGFCEKHMQMLFDFQNSLGLALILSTHIKYMMNKLETLHKKDNRAKKSFFQSKTESPFKNYFEKKEQSCFVCNKINRSFDRYIATIYYLYSNDEAFRKKLKSSKGFCTKHFGLLYFTASKHLVKEQLLDFQEDLYQCYFSNMKRLEEDVEWYIEKFDYRNVNAPWKNSQDAIPRAMTKVNSIFSSHMK